MIRSGTRLALVLLCVFAPALEAQVPAPLKMPNVLWLEQKDALTLLRQRLHRVARIVGEEGIVVAQDPPPDADVPVEGVVAIILGLPNLVLSANNAIPRTDQEVTFRISFEPPPVNPSSIDYHFVWDDGSDVSSAEPQTTRRFTEARTHTIAAYAVINDRWTTGRTEMRLSVVASPPATVTMPQLLWRERDEADALLAPLLLHASIAGQYGVVLGQSIAPGSEVAPGSDLTITLGIPKLTLSTPAVNPIANDEVAFNLAFDPPPPFPPNVTYRIQWADGTEEPPTDQPAATHRFAQAGDYVVSATALINGRWEVESNSLTLSVAGQPQNIPQNIPQSSTAVPAAPPPPPPPIPWLPILLVVAALGAGALLFRILRPRAVTQSPGPPPAVSVRSGLGSTSHTIDNAEQIRNGLSVRLRHGIRSVVTAEGGADA